MSEPTRRSWLRGVTLGIGCSMSGWLDRLAAAAPRRQVKSVILLWMNGGPATIDLWDLKPGHANGGPFKTIATSSAGMRISEHLPRLARWGKELAILRSMTSKQGDHVRATYLLRTGYDPSGTIKYPALGALVSREMGAADSDLPSFVSVAPPLYASTLGGGFLGPRFDPLVIGNHSVPADGLKVPDLARAAGVSDATQAARLDILNKLDARFQAKDQPVVDSIQAATARAIRLMRPKAAAAFRLDEEPAKLRDDYGRGLFGQGCLLARRLVERGVAFVEVTLDGWDTHHDNFDQVRQLSGILDAAYASLLADLQDRGLLDSTLVICQGEFGRTPKINTNTGRDHWPASWAVALAGGGIQKGQVIGKTTADGLAVDERPVSVPDLIATVAKIAGIDPMKQNMSNVGRPIRFADPSAKAVKELL